MFSKQVAVFLSLCHTGSFSRTAEKFLMSQGTVSKYITEIEQKFGPLIIRNHTGAHTNRQGKMVYDYFIEMINSEFEMDYKLIQSTEQYTSITISTIPSISNYFLFQIIKEFQSKFPLIAIQFYESSMRDWEKDLQPQNIDFVFFHKMTEHISQVNYDALLGEKDIFVGVVNENNKLSNKLSLHFDDLANENFFLLDWGTKKVDPILKSLKLHGMENSVSYMGKSLDMVLSSVFEDIGISILLKHTLPNKDLPQTKLIPFVDLDGGSAFLVRKRNENRSIAARLFWEYVMLNSLEK